MDCENFSVSKSSGSVSSKTNCSTCAYVGSLCRDVVRSVVVVLGDGVHGGVQDGTHVTGQRSAEVVDGEVFWVVSTVFDQLLKGKLILW